jgi:hypothetical protein
MAEVSGFNPVPWYNTKQIQAGIVSFSLKIAK